MIKVLLLVWAMQACTPDISTINESQIKLHPSLGIVVTLDSGTEVAYPVYPPVYVEQCKFIVKEDKFNLTLTICYGTMLYILGEPTMFKTLGSTEWVFIDKFCEMEKRR